jgi:hypothetical protein
VFYATCERVNIRGLKVGHTTKMLTSAARSLAVVVLFVTLSPAQGASPGGSHPNCAGCVWQEATYTWGCDQTLQLGCQCVFSDGNCTNNGECLNGICVFKGTPNEASTTRESQLKANPWLADMTIAKTMTAASNTPRAAELVRNQQMYELITGLSIRTMTQGHDETGTRHLMLRVSTVGNSRVFEFWVENGATSLMNEWIAAHPEADEKLVITPTTWALSAGLAVKASGNIAKYEPVRSCTQKP